MKALSAIAGLAIAGIFSVVITACVDADPPAPPSAEDRAALVSKMDPAVSSATVCTSNLSCSYGYRCWYGTCIISASSCTNDCDCGLGTTCYDVSGNGLQCGPDFGPYPECHCNANCAAAGKVCSGGVCVFAGGGGGGGGGGSGQQQ